MSKRSNAQGTGIKRDAEPDPKERAARAMSPRSRRNRQMLIDAARVVFDRDGFYDARIIDVAEEAGVGVGTFYRHFGSKAAILSAAIREIVDQIYDSGALQGAEPHDPHSRIEAANRNFFELYEKNSGLLSLLEQLSPRDPEFREIYLDLRARSVSRLSRALKRWQDEDLVDPSLSTTTVAGSLIAMTNAHAHLWFNLGEAYDPVEDPKLLTDLWWRVLEPRAS